MFSVYTYTKEVVPKKHNPTKTVLSNSAALAQMNAPSGFVQSKNIIQRTVEGCNLKAWLDSHKLTGQKKKLFMEFYNMVHLESSFVFFVEELDSYCEQYFDLVYSQIDEKELNNFDRFKKFVAMKRDPVGAHGSQRHTHEGDKGTRYIYDRVTTGRLNEASYLPLDTFLTWDSKLIRNHEKIFESYQSKAEDLVELIILRSDLRTQAALRTAATGLNLSAPIRIGGGEVLTLTVYSAGAGINQVGENFSFTVKASITSNRQVSSISITSDAANELGIHGAVQGMKYPEAHTGNLAPVFTINKNDDVNNSHEITPDMLKWVTKY